MNGANRFAFALAATAFALTVRIAYATPYASAITNNNGTVLFYLNESGATVYVVFEDGSTNSLGIVNAGPSTFGLGAHTSYQIFCSKTGNGSPTLISSDTFSNSIWVNARGVTVNQNPKIGSLFGRIYAGCGGSGTNGPGSPGYKAQGIYAMNPDQTTALGRGTNAYGSATFANSGMNGPWRMRVAPDNTLLVGDFSTTNAALWQFQPDLSDSNLVLAIIGQAAAAAAGIHGDMFGTPTMTGSLAAGNLVLYTADSGMAVPSAVIAPNLVLGPGTYRGSYNCIFRYNIGSGPLPWNHPPDYAYTVGLDGIPELRTEVEVGKDGKIICGFGRANLSFGNIQILDPGGASVLYNSLANYGGASDPWNGTNGCGFAVGTYAGVRISPDGRYLASLDIDNGVTLALLTNGIPDDTTIFGIPNPPISDNSRGLDWDAANNLYVISSGQRLLRIYSLGVTATCVTSNDWTGTNGTFRLIANRPPVAPPVNAATVQNQPLSIPAEKLLVTATDPDGDPLTLSGVSGTSTNGGSVSFAGGVVTYTPVIGFIGADRFTYTVSDGRGGSVTAFVLVQVRSADQTSGNMLPPVPIPGGYQIRFFGVPARTYTLQRAPAVGGPWLTLAAVVVGTNGLGTFADTNAPPTGAFYRTTYP
jgi:hypothetical protein